MNEYQDLEWQVTNLRLLLEKEKVDEEVHLKTIDTLTKEIDRLRTALEGSEKARETLQDELKWAVSRLRENRRPAELPPTVRDKVLEMQKRIKAISHDISEKEREIIVLKGMVQERDAAIAEVRLREERLRANERDLESVRLQLAHEVEGLTRRVAELEAAPPPAVHITTTPPGIAIIEEKVRRLSSSNIELRDRLKAKERELKAANESLADTRAKLERLKNGGRPTHNIVLNLAPPLSHGDRRCDLCNGRKMVIVQDGKLEKEVPCPRCGGTGRT